MRKKILILSFAFCSAMGFSQLVVNSKGEADFSIQKVKSNVLKKQLRYDTYYAPRVLETITKELGNPSKPNVWDQTTAVLQKVVTKGKKGKKATTKTIPLNATYTVTNVDNTVTVMVDDKSKDQATKTKISQLVDKIVAACSK